MQTLIATIQLRSALGGPIRGDTLFGQLCWAAFHRWGESRLVSLLEGYTAGRPFAVISDAFPSGYLPRPALPPHRFNEVPDADRKAVKKRQWLPVKHFGKPLAQWLRYAVAESEMAVAKAHAEVQPHNTINRITGTTGTGEFAPYVMPQQWFAEDQRFDLYIAHDPDRIDVEEIRLLLDDIGLSGYGRDASIGLGKFDLSGMEVTGWPAQENANAWMTLAPCAPQGQGCDPERSWYQPFTRFGRHGDRAVHSGRPFKTPVLMADCAALLTPVAYAPAVFAGQGLGGDGSLSKAIEETVQQGYAPVLPVRLEDTA